MNRESEKATPTCAFSLRIEKDLYDLLHKHSVETGDSKNKILGMALQRFLREQRSA